jgi:RNA polymerase sigma-70 factor (ECF subfamily)
VQVALAQEEVQRLLRVLTDDQRAVVQLRVFGELTSQEVADTIGKPLTAVKALYLRGLGALRRQIEVDAADGREHPGVETVVSLPVPVSSRAAAAVTRGSPR